MSIFVQNAPNSKSAVWSSALDPAIAGGAYSAPPDLLAEFKRAYTSKGRAERGERRWGYGRGKEGEGGRKGNGEQGPPKSWLTPPMFEILQKYPAINPILAYCGLWAGL